MSSSKRRVRNDPAITRALLLDATEQLMILEGYAAVTTRRVASKVGLTAALVHYYYPTTDDLLLAAYRRAADRYRQRVQESLNLPRPLHALWNVFTDRSQMALGVEFMALANHRKVIRTEIVTYNERSRKLQADSLAERLTAAGINPKFCTPPSLIMLMEGLSRAFVMEEVLGISYGHRETRALVERVLGKAESEILSSHPRRAKSPRRAPVRRAQKRPASKSARKQRSR